MCEDEHQEKMVEPRRDLELLPEDVVRVSFRGSLGQRGAVRLRPGKVEIPCERQDRDEYSEYRADVPLRRLRPGRARSQPFARGWDLRR